MQHYEDDCTQQPLSQLSVLRGEQLPPPDLLKPTLTLYTCLFSSDIQSLDEQIELIEKRNSVIEKQMTQEKVKAKQVGIPVSTKGTWNV